jgi:carboxypeptidase family protein
MRTGRIAFPASLRLFWFPCLDAKSSRFGLSKHPSLKFKIPMEEIMMRPAKALSFLFAFALLMGLMCPRIAAQTSTTGDLTGVVSDPTGAVMPNVKVQLRNVQQGGTRETNTSADGAYRFSLLSPGSYEVDVSATGFQALARTTTVNIGQITTLDLKLALGSTTEKVTVVVEAPLIQTESGSLATTLDERTIQTMPNQGNDMTYPLEMTAHVTQNTIGGYGNYSVNGVSGTGNLFTINGMDDNDPYLSLNNTGATSLMLGQMEVQEATIVANGYGGQYGGLAGSNINYITKGGQNQIHGRADYYWNGRALNTNTFFNNKAGLPKPFVNANQWGGEVGGPFLKDKLFWYFHTEGIRLIIPTAPQTVLVPSAVFETSTLNNLMSAGGANHPASVPFYKQIFGLYDAARMAHNATPGDGTGGTGCGGFTFTGLTPTDPCVFHYGSTGATPTNEAQYSGRIDYNINSNDRLFGHIYADNGFQGTFTDPINTLFNLVSNQPSYSGQLSENHTFGPTMTNQFILSGQWYSAAFTNANQAASLAAFPTSLAYLDGSLTSLAIADCCPNARNVTQFQISDDVTKMKGRHTIKFGVKFRRNDVTDGIYQSLNPGLMLILDLNSFYNGGMIGSGATASDQSLFQQTFPASPSQRMKFWTVGGYLEDDIQVKSNLLLTFALRGDHANNPGCKDLCFARLVEPFTQLVNDPTLGGANAANVPYNKIITVGNRAALVSLTNIEWAPRFGFAWQPFGRDHNTVIRGGIGIFWDTFPGTVVDNISQNPPLYQNFVVSGGLISPAETNSLNSIAANSNQAFLAGFTSGQTVTQIQAAVPAFVPPAINFTPPFTHVPQYQKWSLEVEHGFGRNDSVTVSYTGNHGIHEPVQDFGLNAYAPASAFPSGFVGLPATVPDPRFGFVNGIFSEAVSNYNGLSISATHRYASGLISANYTYSHALDEISNGGFVPMAFQFFAATNTSPIYQEDPHNLRKSMYGSADYDVRQYLSLNYLWELPLKRLTRGHGPDAVLKGWNVSGTLFTRTGFPFTVWDSKLTGALDATNYGGAPSASTVVPLAFATLTGAATNTCTSPGIVTTPCLNAASFLPAGKETAFGNVGRNSFRGPHYFNTDFSFWKSTKVIPKHETAELQLGVQIYNLFNHPNFDNPVADLGSPSTFGTFTHTLSPATTLYGVALGADASMRIVQIKAEFRY